MTHLERGIQAAQRRLWLNRWLHCLSTCLGVAAGAFAAVVLYQRLYDVPMPLLWVGGSLAFAGFAVAGAMFLAKREDRALAAARLDEAAGLRERISSGQYCVAEDDPFAQAVVSDAERVCAALTPSRHLPLTLPRRVGWTASALLLAVGTFLVPAGLLKNTQAKQADAQTAAVEQAKVAVKQQLAEVRRLAENTPALQELTEELDKPDEQTGAELLKPADIRHEALKKIDRLEDAARQKRESGDYDAVREMKKLLRRVDEEPEADAPTRKLTQALQKGELQTAKEEIQSLREQLATLKADEDKEMVAKVSQQLDRLAKQIEQAASDKQVQQALDQAGLTPEEKERLLENLKKQDLEQVQKQLQEKGLGEQQAQKLAQQLGKQQKAGALARKLAESMSRSARAGEQGQIGDSMTGLSQAADQLGELEMLEQEMNQLDGAIADLQGAREATDKPCGSCGGSGSKGGKTCGSCRGRGQGQGNGDRGGGIGGLGQGRGGLAPEQSTDVAFKTEREKVHTGKGAIIGQVLFEGEQVAGEVNPQFAEMVTAAERDASERINRDRIPRQYQKVVKSYFSTIRGSDEEKADTPADAKPAEVTERAEEDK
ncbi:MAG: hypothetical protein HY763_06340 [Planctomycetes bacterium]|nr:hypothetical protein [Planctomycetota bacterium]